MTQDSLVGRLRSYKPHHDCDCWPMTVEAAEAILNLSAELLRVTIALDASVGLQSHYAVLLNQMDGGNRLTFTTGAEWIERLKKRPPQ